MCLALLPVLAIDRAVYVCVQDDYLHHPTMLSELTGIFQSHEGVCAAVPYDYADRYTDCFG